jgi:hypothetical protein
LVEKRNSYRALVGKPERDHLEGPGLNWNNNITQVLNETGLEGMAQVFWLRTGRRVGLR